MDISINIILQYPLSYNVINSLLDLLIIDVLTFIKPFVTTYKLFAKENLIALMKESKHLSFLCTSSVNTCINQVISHSL